MLAQGINASKACVLIALDNMFDGDYEGREFLHDMFAEHWNDTGVNTNNFYLLEECADVIQLPDGTKTLHYMQGDTYVQIYDRVTNLRYRLRPSKKVLYCYTVNDTTGHAICIYASELVDMLKLTTYSNMLLPSKGLIVDYKEWTE